MIELFLGLCLGIVFTWIFSLAKPEDISKAEHSDIEIRYLEKFREIYFLLQKISASNKSRYSKSAQELIKYIFNGEKISCPPPQD